MANFDIDKKQLQDEVVLDDNQLVCVLTNSIKTATEKELLLQSIINQMDEEYEFNLSDMKRDYSFSYEDDEGKKKRMTIDLAIFRHEAEKEPENIERICIVFDSKAKESDKKKGVEATLHKALQATGCDFGMWTNGDKQFFAYRKEDEIGNERIEDISDFPGCDETIEDLENMGDRAQPRKAANDTLIRTFKRCHDYLYGNEGRKKDAFWELLNLIFCKIFDEKRRFTDAEKGFSYRRQFWVGVTEQNTPEGQATVAKRIKDIFERLKKDDLFKTVFDGNEQISLSDRGVAYVASQIAKYSFLDATVDVKGTAYETIVSNTLKQEAGQFFTPRNIIKCMVEIMNPNQHCRVLDPACGSGGFLVMVLDHVRRQITRNIYADRSEAEIDALSNTDETVNKIVRQYAESMIFGFDFDPDLKKAAKMNMVMAGDGHSNIFNINSLEYPFGSLPDLERINEAVSTSVGHRGDYATCDEHAAKDSAFGKFDMIFTNPPFGSKVEVAQGIVEHYDLSAWIKSPEGLFIEQCYNFLKPGGKMAIVLPDGILSNPNTEKVREWILSKFKLIASIDLPVEAFLPQVGVQASLLFLQKKIGIELGQKEDYEVFMAIAEKVGKDRRGNPIYKRDDDGAEILYPTKKEWAARNRHGELITRSRVERVRRLDDDLPEISEEYKKNHGDMKASKIQLTSIEDASRRFDPSYHLSDAIVVKKTIAKSPYPLLKLKEVSSGIFNGGRYKRVYVSNPKHGYKFLSSSDILAADLESVKMVSKRYMGGVKELALEKGWILITRSGTIGKTAFANAKHAQKLASEDVIRLKPNNILRAGAIYAYLASKYGYILLTQGTFGAVIQHIECPFVGEIPIPNFSKTLQESIDLLIQESARLRESAADELEAADKLLKKKAGLRSLTPEDYDYFGQHSATRKPSCFTRKVSEFGSITFNAFNNSERIKAIISSIPESHLTIKDVIENGETFSSTGAPSIEVKPHCGIMLINQKDIFDTIVTGKYISRRGVKTDNLVKYGEVLIASDGTLGENETFCRAIYANEDLEGAFISSHFIRMKSNDKVPAGYLYCWLNSDYGFRLIRRTQAGTKICHPINRMFLDIPVPILAKEDMNKIDRMVRNAHTKRHLANEKELKAIAMVEAEIEKWN